MPTSVHTPKMATQGPVIISSDGPDSILARGSEAGILAGGKVVAYPMQSNLPGSMAEEIGHVCISDELSDRFLQYMQGLRGIRGIFWKDLGLASRIVMVISDDEAVERAIYKRYGEFIVHFDKFDFDLDIVRQETRFNELNLSSFKRVFPVQL